jgi:hypothetical protein
VNEQKVVNQLSRQLQMLLSLPEDLFKSHP